MQNPYIAEALAELIENRDGLVLGVGSGFRTLLDLGLLCPTPAPTITLAPLPHHVSRIARVCVASTLSPWLAAAQVGDIHSLPISTNEGCLTAPAALFEELAAAGQIATQYIEYIGKTGNTPVPQKPSPAPATQPAPQPTLEALPIEGLTSPDGRIFGRMGHPERNAPGLYLNVPGDYDTGIFASGVAYFG